MAGRPTSARKIMQLREVNEELNLISIKTINEIEEIKKRIRTLEDWSQQQQEQQGEIEDIDLETTSSSTEIISPTVLDLDDLFIEHLIDIYSLTTHPDPPVVTHVEEAPQEQTEPLPSYFSPEQLQKLEQPQTFEQPQTSDHWDTDVDHWLLWE